jgi:phosphoenolpyruvate carboxylase
MPKSPEELAADRQIPRDILEKARTEMDRTIERQVEPYRVKIRELERRRADIDEELKGLYMIVGFYDSVRMQAIDGGRTI